MAPLSTAPTMTTAQIIAARLKLARSAAELSLRDLAARVGLSANAISKFETGQTTPSSERLIALAGALERPLDFFVRPFGPEVRSISFRKKSKLGKRQETALRANVKDHVERYLELEAHLEAHITFAPPKHPVSDDPAHAEALARSLRKTWKLGNGPLSNVVEMLEEHGVRVIDLDAPDSFDGCCGWVGNVPFIVLAKWLDADLPRKRFTALHELGHLVLTLPDDLEPRLEENLCHRFANALLLPAEGVRNAFGPRRSRVSLEELTLIKSEYGISLSATLRRLLDLAVITPRHHKGWMMTGSKHGWRKPGGEPGSFIGAERAYRFDQLLARAVADERISLSRAAALTGRSIASLRPHLLGS